VVASSATPAPDHGIESVVASSTAAPDQVLGPAADAVIEPCLDPEDPDACLDAMSNEDLRQHVDELKVSRDRRHATVEKLFKAVMVLKHRESLSGPRKTRSDLASVTPPAAKSQHAAAPGRLQFGTVLGRVDKTAGPKLIEDLAQRLAEDLNDPRSIHMFRRIAECVRSGKVKPKVVSRAYALAKRPGVDRPAAVFTWYVFGRSPRIGRARRATRR
jgi:hypothetical protein